MRTCGRTLRGQRHERHWDVQWRGPGHVRLPGKQLRGHEYRDTDTVHARTLSPCRIRDQRLVIAVSLLRPMAARRFNASPSSGRHRFYDDSLGLDDSSDLRLQPFSLRLLRLAYVDSIE